MKITIAKIQPERAMANVNVSAGLKVSGGATFEGATSSFSLFDTNVALANASVFGISNTSASGNASSKTVTGIFDGTNISVSTSSSAVVSG